jgi:hypothetical protein
MQQQIQKVSVFQLQNAEPLTRMVTRMAVRPDPNGSETRMAVKDVVDSVSLLRERLIIRFPNSAALPHS